MPLTDEALQLATTVSTSSTRTRARLDSYMGRINYGYRDKVFFDVVARVDGASCFGKNYKYGFFPAASLPWRIIEEDFIAGGSRDSDLKLRGRRTHGERQCDRSTVAYRCRTGQR